LGQGHGAVRCGTCPSLPQLGAARTGRARPLKAGNQDDVGRLAKRFITAGTPVAADESEAYNLLHAHLPVRQVNHSQVYRAEDGTNTHQAESFRARFQRMTIGQHHHFGLGYLANDANEIAYREDTRRR
jgi:hypothetical protein